MTRTLPCLLLLTLLSACGVQGPLTLPEEGAPKPAAKTARKTRPVPVEPSDTQSELQSPPFTVNPDGQYEIRGNINQQN